MKLVTYAFLLLLLVSQAGLADSDSDLQRVATYLAIARSNHADLLYPDQFSSFMDRLNHIRSLHEQERSLVTGSLLTELEKWIEGTKAADTFFERTLTIRESSLQLGCKEIATDLFMRAETQREAAVKSYHNGQADLALTGALQSERLYQQAAFYTVENHLLGKIRILFQESLDLGASRFLPATLQKTQLLLERVEMMLRSRRDSDYTFAELSRGLLQQAEHLKYLARVSSRVYQSEAGLEELLLTLDEGLGELDSGAAAGSSETYASYENWFSAIKERAELRESENTLIRDRLRRLETANAAIEQQLLSFQSRSERQLYLEKKIDKVRAFFGEELEWSGEFISIHLDSVDFAAGHATLNPVTQSRLIQLVSAINEFPNALTIIQYIDYPSDSQSYHNLLADQRAKTIDNFLRKHLFVNHDALYVSGFTNQPAASPEPSRSKIEVMINLDAYLKAALNFESHQTPGLISRQ